MTYLDQSTIKWRSSRISHLGPFHILKALSRSNNSNSCPPAGVRSDEVSALQRRNLVYKWLVRVTFCERVCQEDAKAFCCAKDEGGPFGAALWGEASNCRKLLRTKAAVVNVPVKGVAFDHVMWGSERRAEANLW